MKKVFMLVLIVAALAAFGARPALADGYIGEFCWQKAPFPDIVKLAVTQQGNQFQLNGSQYVNGSYSLPMTGTAFVKGTSVIIGLTMTGDLTTNFGGSAALAESVVLSLTTLNGPAKTIGIDGKFAVSPSTWTRVNCPSGPSIASTEDSGKPQGK